MNRQIQLCHGDYDNAIGALQSIGAKVIAMKKEHTKKTKSLKRKRIEDVKRCSVVLNAMNKEKQATNAELEILKQKNKELEARKELLLFSLRAERISHAIEMEESKGKLERKVKRRRVYEDEQSQYADALLKFMSELALENASLQHQLVKTQGQLEEEEKGYQEQIDLCETKSEESDRNTLYIDDWDFDALDSQELDHEKLKFNHLSFFEDEILCEGSEKIESTRGSEEEPKETDTSQSVNSPNVTEIESSEVIDYGYFDSESVDDKSPLLEQFDLSNLHDEMDKVEGITDEDLSFFSII
jgi:hypothetical protein